MLKKISAIVLMAVVASCANAQQRGFFDAVVEVAVNAAVGTAAGGVVGSIACGRRNHDCQRQMAAAGMVTGGVVGMADIQNRRAMEMAQQPVTQTYCERAIDPRSGQWVLVNCRQAMNQTTVGRGVPYWVPQ